MEERLNGRCVRPEWADEDPMPCISIDTPYEEFPCEDCYWWKEWDD